MTCQALLISAIKYKSYTIQIVLLRNGKFSVFIIDLLCYQASFTTMTQPNQFNRRGVCLCSKFEVESHPGGEGLAAGVAYNQNHWDTHSSSLAATYLKAR